MKGTCPVINKMGLPEDTWAALEQVYSAKTTEEELAALDTLRNVLLPEGETHQNQLSIEFEEEDIEKEWLTFAQLQDPADEENPFPGCQLEHLILTQTGLDQFLYYLYERRFGWSECRDELTKAKRGIQAEVEAKNKIHINDHLDSFIRWFQWHNISLQLLSCLTYCIKQATSKPVVRNQTVIHTMEWLQSHASVMAEAHYQPVKTLVLLGITDVWSAIRNACVARLSQVLEFFTVSQLEDFFNELVTICQSPESTWQAKEGAVMGVNSIVRHFQWVSQVSIEEVDEEGAQDDNIQHPQYFLKFGSHEFRGMPKFIESQMHQVIFPLLAHPQLSIREHSIKAFSSFLGRCEFKGALSSFKEVIGRLCRGTGVPENLDKYSVLPHLAILSPDYEFLDAYEAEGLLGVCIFLVKHIPPSHLLPNWPLYFSTFSLFLSHPASTVRQATSSIFKFLVARDSHSPVILKLVLQGLCNGWEVHSSDLATPLLIGNGAANLSELDLGTKDAAIQDGERRISITEIRNGSGECAISDTWQWREGRLLAYELILKFLIKNHCLYTFGPPHLSAPWNYGSGGLHQVPPRPLTPGTSADHALFSRDREEPSHVHSRSFGGSSLHSSLHRTASEKRERPAMPPLSSSPLNTNVALVILPAVDEDVQRERTNSNPTIMSGLTTPDEPVGLSAHPRSYRRGRNSICTSSPSYQLPINLRRRQLWAQNNWMSQAVMGTSDASVFRNMSSRTSSTGAETSQRTLVRHYSFFTEKQDSSSSAPTLAAIPGDNSLNRALSLLMHTLATDLQQEQKTTTLQPQTASVAVSTSSLRRPSLGEAMDSQCEWLQQVELQSLAVILETLLHQAMQSLGDVQWELRRMGQQLLPCVVEVIRWFDMAVLEKLWSQNLLPATSTLTYGACLALKYSVAHAAKLQPMLHTIPLSWQDPEMCRQVVQRITSCVSEGLPTWLTIVHALLRRHQLDRLTTVCVELLLQGHTHFSLPVDQKEAHANAVVGVVLETFCLAHPSNDLAEFIQRDFTITRRVVTLKDGYLSCCVRVASPEQTAQQFEKHLLESLQGGLPAFLQGSPVTVTSSLLPSLAAYVTLYGQNDKFHKAIVDSVSALGLKCKAYLEENEFDEDSASDIVRSNCQRALQELTNVVSLKTVEITLVRQILDIYAVIAQCVALSVHLPYLLKAVCNRSNAGGEPQPAGFPAFLGHVQNGGPDLTLLSNDIPISPTPPPEIPSDSDDEEDDKHDKEMIHESQLLDTSGNSSNPGHHSGSADGRGVSPLPDTSDGGGSDWDSWSEDDVEDDAISSIIGEFLQKIKSQQQIADKPVAFKTILQQLSPKERCLISDIMLC